ncbi:GIY-YIG nuclease family protein, partial [Clostridioides difficile]
PSILINLIDNKEDYIIGKEIEQLT